LKLLSSSGSVFFPPFGENLFFSSFSVLFPFGFSSGLSWGVRAFNREVFQLHEAARHALQMPALSEAFCAQLPQSWAAKILFLPGVPERQQTGQPTTLAGPARQPGLLPRTRKCEAGAAVAGGPSGVFETPGASTAGTVTRDLLGANA